MADATVTLHIEVANAELLTHAGDAIGAETTALAHLLAEHDLTEGLASLKRLQDAIGDLLVSVRPTIKAVPR